MKFGPLDDFSAFPFENYMQTIKKMLRKAEKPLEQLYNRISEVTDHSRIICNRPASPVLMKKCSQVLPVNCSNAHQIIQFGDFTLSTKKPNNCCYMKDNTIVVIEHICHYEHKAVIIGRKFLTRNSLPLYPCSSKNMKIYVVKNLSDLMIWPIDEISNKAIQLPLENDSSWCCMPLLHSS